jgi:hypothetical protein
MGFISFFNAIQYAIPTEIKDNIPKTIKQKLKCFMKLKNMLAPRPNYWYTWSGGSIRQQQPQHVDPEDKLQHISPH